MAGYGSLLLALMLLAVAALRNCPAGLCALGTLTNLLLLVFLIVPLLYTPTLLVLRDACAHGESIALRVLQGRAGVGSAADVIANYYLGSGRAPDGTPLSAAEVAVQINPAWDLGAIKSRINTTVTDVLGSVAAQDFVLAPKVWSQKQIPKPTTTNSSHGRITCMQ